MVKAQGLPQIEVHRDDWHKIVDKAREINGNPDLPLWACVGLYYNVCIPSLVTPLSSQIWSRYCSIQGTKNETFESYQQLPAFWVHACRIIDDEIARIDKIRKDENDRKMDRILKGNRGK